MDIQVYDHSYSTVLLRPGPLQKLAKGLPGVTTMPYDVKHPNDEEAIDRLLNGTASIFFVHVSRGAWDKLVRNLGPTRVAARFSTEALGPTPRTVLASGGAQVVKPLSQVTDEEFNTLVTLFSADAAALSSLRNGVVPKIARSLIRIREPQQLRALYVLLTGTLASWAADDTNAERAGRSRRILGTAAFGAAPVPMDHLATFRRCLNLSSMLTPHGAHGGGDPIVTELAQELGIATDAELRLDPDALPLLTLVTWLTAIDPAGPLDEGVCQAAHTWLRKTLHVPA